MGCPVETGNPRKETWGEALMKTITQTSTQRKSTAVPTEHNDSSFRNLYTGSVRFKDVIGKGTAQSVPITQVWSGK